MKVVTKYIWGTIRIIRRPHVNIFDRFEVVVHGHNSWYGLKVTFGRTNSI